MLRRVLDSRCAEIVALILCPVERLGSSTELAAARQPERRNGSPKRRWRRLLFRFYCRLDRGVFGAEPDPLAEADLPRELESLPVLRLEASGVGPNRLSSRDGRRLRDLSLDVVLHCGRVEDLPAGMTAAARHGVWYWNHGDDRRGRGAPSGFREIMEGVPVTGTALEAMVGEPATRRVLCRSFLSTHRRSLVGNQRCLFFRSSVLPARALSRVHRFGELEALDEEEDGTELHGSTLHRKPANRDMLRFGARVAWRQLVSEAGQLAGRTQWFPAFLVDPAAPRDVPSRELGEARPVFPPADRLWADPFPVEDGNRYVVLFEEMAFGSSRGHIAAITLDEQGVPGDPVKVLERPYHLSYPFVFTWRGERFMVPETYENAAVEVYRATRFPYEWALEATLLEDILAVDATLARIDDHWWMFASVADGEFGEGLDKDLLLQAPELHLFSAPEPMGPWAPHPRNPVVSDVRSARPAGRLFRHRGHWYRPGQDSAVRYGHSITLCRLETLTRDDFREREVDKVRPCWRKGLLGTHTLNAAGGLTVVDGLRRVRRFPAA